MNSEIMTRQAYSEVYNIINHFEKELYAKIPQSFINAIEKNRDLNYKVNIPIVIRRTTNIILKKRCCYPQHDVPVHLQSPKNAANNLRASSQFSRLIQYRTFGVSISP